MQEICAETACDRPATTERYLPGHRHGFRKGGDVRERQKPDRTDRRSDRTDRRSDKGMIFFLVCVAIVVVSLALLKQWQTSSHDADCQIDPLSHQDC